MRVGIIAGPYIPVPPLKYGGTELVIYHLIKGLLEAGHEPILFGPGDSRVDCEVVPIVDKSIYFPTKKREVAAHERRAQKLLNNIEKELRQRLDQLDIIHSHGLDLINFQDVPNLTTLHGPINFDHLQYYSERRQLYYATVSENQQDAFPDLQYVGAVYNGEDPTHFPVVAKPDNYVCFLGRFDREKNPHIAIQLAINLGIKIKLGGKIDYQAEGYFEEEVAKYFDHPLVEYLGELDFKAKVKLLSKAKCNLHPTSWREPFGLTVLEAAYCGTPTLAIDRGSMPELIEDGRTGLLVEDFEEGFHKIDQCFQMDRSYIAQRSRLLFNYQTMTRQYLKAYERVIDIFKTRRQQDEIIRTLTSTTNADLLSIWRSNKDALEGHDNTLPLSDK